MLLSHHERLTLIVTALAALTKEATKGSMGQLRELEEAVRRLQLDQNARDCVDAEP
jgi:hypothetical protein